MGNFIYGTEINIALEALIENAEKYLWFISPYIKLHDRIKSELKKRKDSDQLQIVIMFGKNEDNYEKSISSEDINFLKEFPNVMICYEKNLHAKFYAGDCFSIITSMNLHEYSQNNNIEVAIVMNPRSSALKIANTVVSSEDLEETSRAYFQEIIDNSDVLFQKEPNYESGFLGLSKKYKDSEIVIDKLSEFFTNFTTTIRKQKQNGNTIPENKYNKLSIPKDGFCIVSLPPIPYCVAK